MALSTRLQSLSALPDGGQLLTIHLPHPLPIRPGHWFHFQHSHEQRVAAALDHSDVEGWLSIALPRSQAISAQRLAPGAPCTLDGPHGDGLAESDSLQRTILITDPLGLPALLFLARRATPAALALVALDQTDWVRLRPSRYMLPQMPAGVIAGLSPLEEAGIPSRASHAAHPGCHDGPITELLDAWLGSRRAGDRWQDRAVIIGEAAFITQVSAVLRGRIGQYQGLPIPA